MFMPKAHSNLTLNKLDVKDVLLVNPETGQMSESLASVSPW